MSYLFFECKSLITLPDISKWNTFNVENMRYTFFKCNSLISLPDISKWNTLFVENIECMFLRNYSIQNAYDSLLVFEKCFNLSFHLIHILYYIKLFFFC